MLYHSPKCRRESLRSGNIIYKPYKRWINSKQMRLATKHLGLRFRLQKHQIDLQSVRYYLVLMFKYERSLTNKAKNFRLILHTYP